MTFEEYRDNYMKKHAGFYREPSVAYIEPFHVYGPLYYVGDRQVCVHLIDTGEGLLLIDAGFPHTIHMLIDSIYRLGFRPADVKCILHTHGHFDHFGASNEFKRLYGCKLAISRADAELLSRCPEASLLSMAATVAPMAYEPDFDVLLEDGEDFVMGGVSIRCKLIPGHTPGTMAFFTELTENGRTLRAGLFGGAGLGSLRLSALRRFDEPLSLRGDMLASIARMREERVDIMLGNHPKNNDTLGRRARQLAEGGNPFIDAAAWGAFLDKTQADFEQLYAEDRDV